MGSWKDACRDAEAMGWTLCEVPLPEYSESDAIKVIDSCRRNLCGNYGTSWACPPGWTDRMDILGRRYDSAILMEKEFDVDVKNETELRKITDESHSVVRSAVRAMRAAGFECMGFTDGECGYCGVCSYPEPCRFPDQLVASISSTGIELKNYFDNIGKDFSFSDDHVIFYGMIMFRRMPVIGEEDAIAF